MTKKDYILIADGIHHHRKQYGGRTDSIVREVVYSLSQALQQDNDKFNAEMFTSACMKDGLCNCGKYAGFHEKEDDCRK